MFKDYLIQIGLEDLVKELKNTALNTIVEDAFAREHKSFTQKEIMNLYTYYVPKLSPDQSCSIIGNLDPLPYNLAQTFGLEYDIDVLKNNKYTFYLWHLKEVITNLQKLTKVNWLGIYKKAKNQKEKSVLVKESYYGAESRAEFPLTLDFAKKSNNSTVGLTGKAVIIQSVAKHNGAYYKCDGKVNSEFCLPIIDDQIIGIIDAEAFLENFFTNEKLLQIAKTAYDLAKISRS